MTKMGTHISYFILESGLSNLNITTLPAFEKLYTVRMLELSSRLTVYGLYLDIKVSVGWVVIQNRKSLN